METLIMHPKNEDQALALKAIAKAWKINIETRPYDPAFVAMVKVISGFSVKNTYNINCNKLQAWSSFSERYI